MYTGSEGLSLQANFVILGLLRLEMLSFITRFNISDILRERRSRFSMRLSVMSIVYRQRFICVDEIRKKSDYFE